jgi:hypothetical protein
MPGGVRGSGGDPAAYSILRKSLSMGNLNAEIEKQYLPSEHHGELWPVAAEGLQMALEEGFIP